MATTVATIPPVPRNICIHARPFSLCPRAANDALPRMYTHILTIEPRVDDVGREVVVVLLIRISAASYFFLSPRARASVFFFFPLPRAAEQRETQVSI